MGEVTANAIEERLIGFAVRIIKLADELPETLSGKHIARQQSVTRMTNDYDK